MDGDLGDEGYPNDAFAQPLLARTLEDPEAVSAPLGFCTKARLMARVRPERWEAFWNRAGDERRRANDHLKARIGRREAWMRRRAEREVADLQRQFKLFLKKDRTVG